MIAGEHARARVYLDALARLDAMDAPADAATPAAPVVDLDAHRGGKR